MTSAEAVHGSEFIKPKKDKKHRDKSGDILADNSESVMLAVCDKDSDKQKKLKKEKKLKKTDLSEEADFVVQKRHNVDGASENADGKPRECREERKKSKKSKREEVRVDEDGSDTLVKKKKKKERDVPDCGDDEAAIGKKEKRKSREQEPEFNSPQKEQKGVSVATPTTVSHGTEEAWEDEDQSSGSKYLKLIDEEKWKSKVEGTKFAKISHYDKGGDSWGNEAADVLSKVKGKGFVKAMQKLKRASWKGQGSIDTGINSVQFSDWED